MDLFHEDFLTATDVVKYNCSASSSP